MGEPAKSSNRRFEPLPTRVIVRDMQDEIVREHDFDFNDYNKRKWLERLQVWGLFNHHSVEIIAIADDENRN